MKQFLYGLGAFLGLLVSGYNGEAQAQLTIPASEHGPLLMRSLDGGGGVLHGRENKFAELRTWEYRLPNGVKLVVRPDDSAREVYIRGFSSRGALSLAAPGTALYYSALGAGGYMRSGGLGTHDAADLRALLGARDVEMRQEIAVSGVRIAGRCGLPELETALQLIYLSFTAPRPEAAAFINYRKGLKAALLGRRQDSYRLFRDSVDRLTGVADTGMAVFTAAGIDSMRPGLCEEAYRRCFGDAAGFTFVVTGKLVGSSMNVSRYLRLIESYLAALPSSAGAGAGSGDEETTTGGGASAGGRGGVGGAGGGAMTAAGGRRGGVGEDGGWKMIAFDGGQRVIAGRGEDAGASLLFAGDYVYGDSANLQLAAESTILQSIFRRLAARAGLRVADDTVVLNLTKVSPARFLVELDFRCRAAEWQRAVAVARGAVDSLRQVGDDDIRAYRDEGRKALRVLTFNSVFWTNYLEDKYRHGDDPYAIAHFPYNYRQVTAESMRRTAEWSLRPERSEVVALVPRGMTRARTHGEVKAGKVLGPDVGARGGGAVLRLDTAVRGGGVKTGAVLGLDTAVRTGRLANGFTYYVRRNAVPEHRVGFYLVNKVGSILESEDQRGLAHFMEHMNFNGTTHFPKNELIDYLQRAGVRFGADVNAYTSFDETVYELPLATDRPGLLGRGLLILHDWAQGATLDPEEIEKERGVVLEEKRLHRGAGQRLSDRYLPMLMGGSRYADRLPIGTDTVLRNFHPATIRRFYHDWYRPDLQALIVVGDIDPDSMVRAIGREFADLRNPAAERPRPKYSAPLAGTNNFLALSDPEVDRTSAQIMLQHRAPVLKTAADYRSGMVRQLLVAMLSNRYERLSRESDPPFVTVEAGLEPGTGGLESLTVATVAKPGQLDRSVEAAWREFVRVQRYGFTAAELERAKKNAAARIESRVREGDKTNSGDYIREYMNNFLHGTASPGIHREYALFRDYLPGISLRDIDTLNSQLATKENRKMLVLAPAQGQAAVPDSAQFTAWLLRAEQGPLKPYTEESIRTPLLSGMRAPGTIVSERRDAGTGITELHLSNGMRVLLKPTIFANDRVNLALVGTGGMSAFPDSDYFSGATSAEIIAGGGIGNYDETQLREYLAGKHAGVSPFIAGHSDGFNGGASTDDLEQALQLVYGYCTAPRADSSWYANVVGRLQGSLLHRDNDPRAVFGDTISEVLNDHDFRGRALQVQDLDKVKLAECLRIFKDRFSNAAGFTAILVGSFDTSRLRPLLEKYLASLPSTGVENDGRDYGVRPPAGPLEKVVYKGKDSAKATVQLFYTGETQFNRDERLRLEALAGVMRIRLTERLREQESGVYTPGVSADLTKITGKDSGIYRIKIEFTCAPQHLSQLLASTYDEVEKLRREGPSPVNLGKFQVESIAAMEPSLKNNVFWINYLKEQVRNGAALDEVYSYPDAVRSLSVPVLKAAAQQYLGEKNRLLFKLLPER